MTTEPAPQDSLDVPYTLPPMSSKVRMFLHELKKLMVEEGLDRIYHNGSQATLYVPPTTQAQVALVRSWLAEVVFPAHVEAIAKGLEEDVKQEEAKKVPEPSPQDEPVDEGGEDFSSNVYPQGHEVHKRPGADLNGD